MRRLLLAFLTFLVAACDLSMPAPPGPPMALTTRPDRLVSLHIRRLTTDTLRRGGVIGRYVWTLECAPPAEPVYWTSEQNFMHGEPFIARIRESLRNAGYATDPQEKEGAARLVLFGELRSVSLTLCRRLNWLTGKDKAVRGEGRVSVEWTLRDRRANRVVARVVTTGAGALDEAVPEGDAAILERAVAAAAARLTVEPAFISAFSDPEPAAAPVGVAAPAEEDALDRAAVRVGRRVWAESGGGRVEGTVSGHSRDRDGDRPVILVDFDGKTIPADTAVSDAGGRLVGRALPAGPRAAAAWTGLIAVVADDTAGGGDPLPPEPDSGDGDSDTHTDPATSGLTPLAHPPHKTGSADDLSTEDAAND